MFFTLLVELLVKPQIPFFFTIYLHGSLLFPEFCRGFLQGQKSKRFYLPSRLRQEGESRLS